MTKLKTATSRLKPYILSFIIVLLLFVSTGFLIGHFVNEYLHNQIVSEAMSLTESTGFILESMMEATHTIEELMEEKLEAGSKVIMNYDGEMSNEYLKHIAKDMELDEVYVYNEDGEIIYTNGSYLGWIAPSNHIVYQFIQSKKVLEFDDIRPDSESNEFFKYAYFRLDSGHVVQTGLKAERIQNLTGRFSIESHLNGILAKETILKVDLLYDEDALSSLIKERRSEVSLDDFEQKHFLSEQEAIRELEFEHQDVLEIISPVIVKDAVVGSLFIYYNLAPTQKLGQLVLFFIGMLFALLTLIMGILMWSLYLKNQNIDDLSHTDSELGIYNRNYFLDVMEEKIEDKSLSEGTLILLVLENLSRLRLIHSYAKIHHVLASMQFTLNDLWEEDIYRYNEDTLILYVEDKNIIDKVQNTKTALLEVDHLDIGMNPLAGVLNFSETLTSRQDIAQNIELAILDLKDKLETDIVEFDETLWDQVIYLETLESDLRQLSRRGFNEEMFVVFQPQIDLQTGNVSGFETLARWMHPRFGFVPPNVFFDIAERSDLVFKLSDWVMEESALFAKSLHEKSYCDLHISFNVSVALLKADMFKEDYLNLIKKHQLNPQHLGIEITETMFKENLEKLNQTIKEIRDLDVEVSLDDFGTGYASLSSLQNIHIDTLKIDKSFIDTMFDDETFIQGIVDLAKRLKLKIVAEGVESKEQVQYLKKMHVNTIQGFYYSKPLRKDEAIAYLQSNYDKL